MSTCDLCEPCFALEQLREEALAVLVRDYRKHQLHDGLTVRLDNLLAKLSTAEDALQGRRVRGRL